MSTMTELAGNPAGYVNENAGWLSERKQVDFSAGFCYDGTR